MVIYLLIILFVGFAYSSHKSNRDYMFSSRKITLPSFIATFVTTWYGGILEVGRFTYQNGIVTWFIFGFFYYISAFLFLKFFSYKIHNNNIDTIPEYFHKYFGYSSGLIASFIILLISSPAPYLMIFSTIFTYVYDISYFYSLLIGIFFSISYIISGGFKSIIRTDKIQFTLMYFGFIIIFISLYLNYGGITFLKNNLPCEHLSPISKLPLGYILSWSIISMITFIDPNIYQRVYTAKDKQTIKKGVLLSILFWIIFDFLTISVGLYAAAIIPQESLTHSPYLMISDIVLSPTLRIIFLISLLSIVMSSIDSFTFTSAITIAKEIGNNNTVIFNTRVGLIITCFTSLIIATSFKHVIDIWYLFGSIGASCILIPFIKILNTPQTKIHYPLTSLLIPGILCVIWIYMENPFGIDCLYAGVSMSIFMNFYFYRIKHS